MAEDVEARVKALAKTAMALVAEKAAQEKLVDEAILFANVRGKWPGPESIKSYERALKTMAGRPPDPHASKKTFYHQRAASLWTRRMAVRNALDALNQATSQQDQSRRRATVKNLAAALDEFKAFKERWPTRSSDDWERGDQTQIQIERERSKREGQKGYVKRSPRGRKMKVPDSFENLMMERALRNNAKAADPTAVCLAFGLRPFELEKGVKLHAEQRASERWVGITIKNAKEHADEQGNWKDTTRTLWRRADDAARRHLDSLVRNGVSEISIRDRSNFSKAFKNFAIGAFGKKVGQKISPYSSRHALVSDLKLASAEAVAAAPAELKGQVLAAKTEQTALAVGHSSEASQSAYGSVAFGREGRGGGLIVESTREITRRQSPKRQETLQKLKDKKVATNKSGQGNKKSKGRSK